MWRCTICEMEVAEEQSNGWRCPHKECDVTWCGDDCCGAYAEWKTEGKGDPQGDQDAEKKTAG